MRPSFHALPVLLMRLVLSLLASVVAGGVAHAQGVLSVSADRASYGYGEVIEIQVTVTNPSDAPFAIVSSTSCQAGFRFDDFDVLANRPCTADASPVHFPPGSWRTWSWKLDPAALGLPSFSGRHTIVGYFGPLAEDTTYIEAPAYLGGQVRVGWSAGTTPAQMAPVKDTLQVVVLERDETGDRLTELWQIEGITVDSAVARYRDDPRFRYIEGYRRLAYDQVVATEDALRTPPPARLTAHPNPFADAVTVEIHVAQTQPVRLVVYDLLGRVVVRLHDGPLAAGTRHAFVFEAAGRAPGVYLYRAEGPHFSTTGRLVLAR